MPADQQKVIDDVAKKLKLSPDQVYMSCRNNFVKKSANGGSTTTAAAGRHLLQTAGGAPATVCRPRVTITISVPIGADNTSLTQNAIKAADAMDDIMGTTSCYVPTASENTYGTLVKFETTSIQVRAPCFSGWPPVLLGWVGGSGGLVREGSGSGLHGRMQGGQGGRPASQPAPCLCEKPPTHPITHAPQPIPTAPCQPLPNRRSTARTCWRPLRPATT